MRFISRKHLARLAQSCVQSCVVALVALSNACATTQTTVPRATPTATVAPSPTPVALNGTIADFQTEGSPDTIVAGADNAMWFVSISTGRIGRITPDGRISYSVQSAGTKTFPSFITAGPDGVIWYTARGYST